MLDLPKKIMQVLRCFKAAFNELGSLVLLGLTLFFLALFLFAFLFLLRSKH